MATFLSWLPLLPVCNPSSTHHGFSGAELTPNYQTVEAVQVDVSGSSEDRRGCGRAHSMSRELGVKVRNEVEREHGEWDFKNKM